MSVEQGIVVEQQQKPNEGFSSKLAEIRAHAQKAAWLPIDQKVQELDSKKGILKIPVALARRLLDRQERKIQRQLEQPDKIKPERDELPSYPYKQPKPLRQNEEESLLAVGNEIRTVRNNYEQLAEDIIQDGTIPAEIRDAYIQEVISPEVDRLVRGTNLTSHQKDEFYSALHAYLDHKDEPDSMRQPYKKELDRFMQGIYELENYCQPLIDGADTTVVQHLIARIAAEDLKAIKTSVLLQLKSADLKRRFLIIYSDIFGEGFNPRPTFATHLSLRLQGRLNIPDMRIWQALKSSRTANEIFSEAIKDQDQENYTTGLNASLSGFILSGCSNCLCIFSFCLSKSLLVKATGIFKMPFLLSNSLAF